MKMCKNKIRSCFSNWYKTGIFLTVTPWFFIFSHPFSSFFVLKHFSNPQGIQCRVICYHEWEYELKKSGKRQIYPLHMSLKMAALSIVTCSVIKSGTSQLMGIYGWICTLIIAMNVIVILGFLWFLCTVLFPWLYNIYPWWLKKKGSGCTIYFGFSIICTGSKLYTGICLNIYKYKYTLIKVLLKILYF